MSLDQWVPSLTTTALFGAACWMGRSLIATRLTKSVEHEFNEKLEHLRSEQRQSEELLRAELRSREGEISALRSTALTALTNRHVGLDTRKLEAVDQLWSAMTALVPARNLAGLIGGLRYEEAQKAAQLDLKFRQTMEAMIVGFNISKIDVSGAMKARPFVSPMAWAIYNAYRVITVQAAMRAQALKAGATNDFIDNQKVQQIILVALPEYSNFIQQHGASAAHLLLDSLEDKLLMEFNQMLSSKESSAASIEQAAQILKLSSEAWNDPGANPATA